MSDHQHAESEDSSNTQVEPGSPFDKSAPAADKDQPQPRVNFTNAFQNTQVENVEEEKAQDRRPKREELHMGDVHEQLGFGFSSKKKWTILTIIFLVQVSMNFNTSLYSNGLEGISSTYGVSEQGARCGAMIFLVLYAFGCELWAPWSEELGRKPVLQLSLALVNIWNFPVSLNVGRFDEKRELTGVAGRFGSELRLPHGRPCSGWY